MDVTPCASGVRLITPRIDVDITTFFRVVSNVRQIMRTEGCIAAVDLSSCHISTSSELLCLGVKETSLTSLQSAVEEEMPHKRRMSRAERKKAKKGVTLPHNKINAEVCEGNALSYSDYT